MDDQQPYVTLCGHVVDAASGSTRADHGAVGAAESDRHSSRGRGDGLPPNPHWGPARQRPESAGGPVGTGARGQADRWNGDTRLERPALHECIPPVDLDGILNTLEEGILLLDPDLQVVAANRVVGADTGATMAALVGSRLEHLIEVRDFDRIRDFAAQPQGSAAQLTIHHGSIRTATGDRLRAQFEFVSRGQSARAAGLVMVYRLAGDEADRRRREQRQERLGLVNQFNTTLRRVARAIVNPTSRTDLEEIVCKELAAARPYEFAVIVEERPTARGNRAEPKAWAGIEDVAVEKLLDPIDAADEQRCPITRAITEGTVQVAVQINRNPVVAECLADISMDVASVAVVPIQYEETNYGVLAVYSSRDGPFGDYELRMLEDLGEIVGFSYNAVDKDTLLSTDSIVELEFEITDRDSFFVAASAAADCTITLESVVPTSDGHLLYYHRIEGTEPDRLLELAARAEGVASAEVIRAQEDACWMVFRLADRSLVEGLSRNNINVRQVEAADGVARLVCEVSPTVGVTTVTDVVRSMYDDFELVAKRRRERPARTAPTVQHEAMDSLTEKQRQTLDAAYQSGYFNRPRGSTAEEIADQLGISSSTFHQHLRAAMSKLMAGLLESESQRSVAPQ